MLTGLSQKGGAFGLIVRRVMARSTSASPGGKDAAAVAVISPWGGRRRKAFSPGYRYHQRMAGLGTRNCDLERASAKNLRPPSWNPFFALL